VVSCSFSLFLLVPVVRRAGVEEELGGSLSLTELLSSFFSTFFFFFFSFLMLRWDQSILAGWRSKVAARTIKAGESAG